MGGTLTHPLQRPEKSEKYLLMRGLKSLSAPSSADLPGGPLTQLSKVQNGFSVPKLRSRTLSSTCVKAAFRKKEEINQGSESKLSVSIWGESGQWKYDKQLHKQQVPFTQYTKGPSAPPPCSVTLSILVQVPLWHPAVLRSWFHLPLPFFLALTCFHP